MQVTYVLQMLRVYKGVFEDKLGLTKKDWKLAYDKYQWIQIQNNQFNDSICTDSDIGSLENGEVDFIN